MKLRNKKTGEMGITNYFDNQSIVIYPIDENWEAKGDKKYVYYSLTELNDEWEDYSPKVFYYINENGGVLRYIPSDPEGEDETYIKYQKEIGNYFETQEEAEQAVEKLKAWKRLKDKGFKFTGYDTNYGHHRASFVFEKEAWATETEPDLDLLFGGEE